VAGAAGLAPGSRTILDCPVTRIDHAASPIALTTPRGTLTASAVIVTVPTSILATERLVFDPALPRVTDAAGGLPLGLADKAFLHVARPEALPVEGHLFGHTDRSQTASYHLRPFGRPYIEVYVGGRHAHALEAEGTSALTDFALDELRGLLGSDLAGGLTPIARTAWARDRFALGAYSHALPGHAAARAVLAAPHENRLFFAGEATHATFFSTAHGAWETGVRAAREAAAALGV
jgi:monoamine oxidase